MTKLLLFILSGFFSLSLGAQGGYDVQKKNARDKKTLDTIGWEHTGFFIFNVNQAALSNWSSGGERFLIGINGIFNYSSHHRKGKFTKDSYLDIELGVVEAASFRKFRKTTDRCDITMELEHSIRNSKLNYGLLFNFNSQIFGGHNYSVAEHNKISSFLSPGKILFAPGIDFKNQNSGHYFSLFISPATFRFVTKLDDEFRYQSKFGVDSSDRINTEIGAYLSSHYNMKISKTANYIGRLDLFSNYKRKPGNIDVLMNNLIVVNISKIFAANILVDVLYDDDVKGRAQIQEIFGMGLKLNL
jgi:hypothetical protein